jgi:CheY-like chemotaxis protein
MAEKILVIDDDLETLRLVGLMLQRQGYEIIAASNGTEGIKAALTDQPDVILLDVMMPDMDGFEVTRKLRADPKTTGIPILMFTAKAQIDDKVLGYEVGVDDYLTKPTHPAELTAHVKVLLSRSGRAQASALKVELGRVVGVIAAKGGMGTSTIALNTAIGICQKMKANILAVELRPGQGTWGLDLGFNRPDGLNNLLQMKPEEITAETLERELITLPSGPRLLFSSFHMKSADQIQNLAQIDALFSQLASFAQLTVVDIGNVAFAGADRILSHCNELLLITEPNPTSIIRTKALMEDLTQQGFGLSRLLTVVVVNRVRADVQLSLPQVQDALGVTVNYIVSPAPELSYQASTHYLPLIQVKPDSLITQQLQKLADFVALRVRPK